MQRKAQSQSCSCTRFISSLPWVNIVAWILHVAGFLIIHVHLTDVINVYKKIAAFAHIEIVPTIMTIIGIVCGFLTLLLGVFSTGWTRKSTCSNKNRNTAGRVLNVIAMVILWILFLVITALTVGMILDACIIYALNETCVTFKTFTPTSCVKFNETKAIEKVVYHINKFWPLQFETTICGNALKDICGKTGMTFSDAGFTLIGCLLVIVGYVLALQATAANYVHIKYQPTKIEYDLRERLYDVPFNTRTPNRGTEPKGTYFHSNMDSEVFF